MTRERYHGTIGGYSNHKCRCDECRASWALYMRGARLRRLRALGDNLHVVHGTESTYVNHLCSCLACRSAHAAYTRSLRNRATPA